jgi:hypothetical protein
MEIPGCEIIVSGGIRHKECGVLTETASRKIQVWLQAAKWALPIPFNVVREAGSCKSGQGGANRPLTPDSATHTLDFSESMVRTTFTENSSWLDIHYSQPSFCRWPQ